MTDRGKVIRRDIIEAYKLVKTPQRVARALGYKLDINGSNSFVARVIREHKKKS